MAKPEKLPLLNDYIFKHTFTKEGTTGILKDLLEAILEVKITNLEVRNSEMPKFIKKNPGVEGKLEQWLWLISGREEKIKMAGNKNEEVKKAGILVDEMSMDPKERELYEARLMAKYNYDSGMAGAREAGIEEGIIKGKKAGIAEGKKSKQMQIAKKMKEKGMKEEDIEEITGLSEEEIKGL